MLDIGIGAAYPANVLSNLYANEFIFDGVKCGSMEGLLQSLKFKDIEQQRKICGMSGVAAKFRGRKKKWTKDQTLYWKGEPFSRHSEAYQNLLSNAFYDLCEYSDKYKQALIDSKNHVLCHSIGYDDPMRTILTVEEFLCRLTLLRSLLLAVVNKSDVPR